MSEAIANQAERVETLRHVIEHLHAGCDPEQVRDELRNIVRQTEAAEIVAMEQELIDGGMAVDEIRSMCDMHSQLTREILVQRIDRAPLTPGHPAETFASENTALRGAIAATRAAASALATASEFAPTLLRLRQQLHYIMDVDKHYRRKEQVLFPVLERHGITGPSRVMWAKDDEVRALLAEGTKKLAECPALELAAQTLPAIERALAAVEEMIAKEENILFPLALEKLTAEEWAEIFESSNIYGWCLIEPGRGYKPAASPKPKTNSNPLSIMLETGQTTVEQLEAILSTLPLDLTFVDADDRVAFYSEGPLRAFARSKAIIGRKVQYCHPVNSIGLVDRILADFRSGSRDVAEFYVHIKQMYLHIRFFAVRDTSKKYLGALEMVQDIAPLQRIEGERRLLDEGIATASA